MAAIRMIERRVSPNYPQSLICQVSWCSVRSLWSPSIRSQEIRQTAWKVETHHQQLKCLTLHCFQSWSDYLLRLQQIPSLSRDQQEVSCHCCSPLSIPRILVKSQIRSKKDLFDSLLILIPGNFWHPDQNISQTIVHLYIIIHQTQTLRLWEMDWGKHNKSCSDNINFFFEMTIPSEFFLSH